MGDKTKIEWTDATWNPVTGCDQVSPGCANCYALTMAKRLKLMGNPRYQVDGDDRTSGPGFGVTLHPDLLDQPLRWKRPRRIFVNSMSDLFHPDVPNDFIVDVFAHMIAAPQHTFQVLTKRPQRMAGLIGDPKFANELAYALEDLLEDESLLTADAVSRILNLPHVAEEGGVLWPNVWLGVSIESDRYAFRADLLRATPAAVRFISAEPLLGPLPSLDLTGIDWLIVGGESGHGARPMHPDWVRDLRDRCLIDDYEWRCEECGELSDTWDEDGHPDLVNADPDRRVHGGRLHRVGPAFFFQHWGSWVPGGHPTRNCGYFDLHGRWQMPDVDGSVMMHTGSKHENGRELDGRTWDEKPT